MQNLKIKIIKFIYFLILLFFLISSSGCGGGNGGSSSDRFNVPAMTNWTKESGTRLAGNVSTSTIRLNNGRYRIFYPGNDGVASAVSSDGLLFTREAGTRVAKGSAGSYDAEGAKDPDIVIEDGYWRMYYTAIGSDNKHRVMSAISTDGYTFTKEAGVRLDYSASYDQLADVQSVAKVSSSEYRMYYVYDWDGDNSIKGASATAGSSTFEVKTLSGFGHNCMDPEVIYQNGTFIMYFAAPRPENGQEPMDIYKATSTDGTTWTVVGRAIAPETSNEGNIVGDPDIIQLPDNTYRMYYYGKSGSSDTGYNILSATAESL